MESMESFGLIWRYILLLLFGIFINLFYDVFTPLTVYPVFWTLSVFYSNASLLEGNLIFFGGIYVELISACIAGAAYYLLLTLNLTTSMKAKTRVKSIIFLFGSFLILNIIRIIIFSYLAVSGSQYFDIAHNLVWYLGSTLLLVLVWFVNAWLFKIRSIPVYSDIKCILEDIFHRKRME